MARKFLHEVGAQRKERDEFVLACIKNEQPRAQKIVRAQARQRHAIAASAKFDTGYTQVALA